MSDGLKVENVELLTDEFTEESLTGGGASTQTGYDAEISRARSGSQMWKRVAVAALLVACGALSYPLAVKFGQGAIHADTAGQEPVVVGLHEAGREHKPVSVLTGRSAATEEGATSKAFPERFASAEGNTSTGPQKVSVVRDASEQLVPRGSFADNGEATNVSFQKVAANNYKPGHNGGVQVETPGTSTGNSPKLDGSSGGTKIQVPISQGRLLRFDDEVDSVFVADPAIADVKVLSTNEIYVFGKKAGITTLQATSNNKRSTGEAGLTASVQLYVGHDPDAAADAKETIARGAPLSFSYQGDRMVMRGHARNPDEAIAGHEIAKNFSNGREPLDLAGMNGSNQVNIRVRFAEINRSDMQGLGIDWGFSVKAGSLALGVQKNTTWSGGLTPNISAKGAAPGVGGSIGNFVDINVLIEALQKNGVVNILAEPNLTAVTGETASFLAGGEVPIPVATGTGSFNSNNTPQLSVMYKTFGVSLQFTPTIIKNNRIALRVKPEVSSIAGTSNFGVNGVAMPNFTVRRTDTVVEVASGQTFAIAGLFQRELSRSIEKFPLLGDLPVLGTLFQSQRFQRNETELVILITPYLVEPVSDRTMATPLDKRNDQNTMVRPAHTEVERPKPAPKQVDPGQSGFIYK